MSRVPLVSSFICGTSLQTGAKTIGYAQVLVNGLQTFLYMFLVINITEDANKAGVKTGGIPAALLKWITAIYFEALCGVVLLMGVYWDKSSYIKAWVLIQWALIVQNTANILLSLVICFLGYSSYLKEYVITKVIGLILDLYYTVVVYSFYRKTYYRDSFGNLLYDEVIDSLE